MNRCIGHGHNHVHRRCVLWCWELERFSTLFFWLKNIFLQHLNRFKVKDSGFTIFITNTHAFTNPIKSPAADPSIIVHKKNYYLTATGTTQITVTRSRTLTGLQNGTTTQVWADDTPTRDRDIWAPEIHLIDSTWYILYSASGSANGRSKRSQHCGSSDSNRQYRGRTGRGQG